MIDMTILGSTGTIGVNTLDVVSRMPDKFNIFALTANFNTELMYSQCLAWHPDYVVMVDEAAAEALRKRLISKCPDIEVLSGATSLEFVSEHDKTDYVMAGIVGAAGLLPSLAAAKKGKRVLLANKEALVMSGQLFMDEIAASGAELLPIDSEHNAIFQCLPKDDNGHAIKNGVGSILLTASGGPFRGFDKARLKLVTPEQACAHPNWDMGKKISVDSATMMNKGLEVIEACWLFDVSPNDVNVVIHPQSVIHSMVQYVDGSVIAQMGRPDMRTPIAYSLGWPDRVESGVANLDLFTVARLDFEEPDDANFPCLNLAREAFSKGGTAPAVMNAANEVAVAAFLERKILFTEIPWFIEQALSNATIVKADSLEKILEADLLTRHALVGLLMDRKK
jgi:1-deoxy-D-xylulose-5-phosphate reductoisomerase